MKFSEISEQDWGSLQPYLDTCLLPVTGITGAEQPWEATAALENLRDVLDKVEIPFKGRVVTYPALHYTDGSHERLAGLVDQVCSNLKASGFKYVIVMTADSSLCLADCVQADLVLQPESIASDEEAQELDAKAIASQVQQLWNRSPAPM